MANSKRKCKWCKKYVTEFVTVPAGTFCTIDHALEFANKKTRLRSDKAAKAARSQHRKDKERVKSKAKWLAELQTVFNKYIRLRDRNDGCISCDKPSTWQGQWHCSHYYSRGASSSLRFNLHNCHKSCSVCNSHLSGNIGEYTPRLIEKIGQDNYDWLEAHKSNVKSYDIEWIKRAIKICRKAVKREESKLIQQNT